jgi:hypothetical protein
MICKRCKGYVRNDHGWNGFCKHCVQALYYERNKEVLNA